MRSSQKSFLNVSRPLVLSGIVWTLVSCATGKEVKDIDTSLEVKGTTEGGHIGVDKDGVAVVQENADASDALRRQKFVNANLEEKLATDYNLLKKCREDLADSRLGGAGEVSDLPGISDLKSVAAVRESFGRDKDGQLKVLKRTDFSEMLQSEKTYEQKMRDTSKQVIKYQEDCRRRLRSARVGAGLPAESYKAKGYYKPNGGWVEERKAERTLDDAFEIRDSEKAK